MFEVVLVISKYPQAFFNLGCVKYASPLSVYLPLDRSYTTILLHFTIQKPTSAPQSFVYGIIQSADGQYLALYCKAGLTIAEAGKPVLTSIRLIPADRVTYLSSYPLTHRSTLPRVCWSSFDQLSERLGKTQ